MRPARRLASNLAAVSGILLVSTAFADIPYIETWDDPAKGNHNWVYFQDAVNNKVPVTWSGGVVRTDFGVLPAPNLGWVQNCFSPFSTYAATREPSQNIYLTPDTIISVDILYSGGLGSTLGAGNSIYFVIGQYFDGASPHATFYRREYPIRPYPKGEWHTFTFTVGDATDWTLFHYNKANPVITPISEFWDNPEQYAFAIMDDDLVTEDNDPPAGAYLSLDDFRVIPEASATPWVFALSALGFACLRRLGR